MGQRLIPLKPINVVMKMSHFKENMMKKIVITYVISLLLAGNVFATTKCVPDGRGGMCCWDVDSQGPFKPINC